MSQTKNALLRYRTIDKCLKNKARIYLIDDLLLEVNKSLLEESPSNHGIQIRQLRDDIRFMRSENGYAAPIETKIVEGKKHAYFYSDNSYSINNSPLNQTEINQIKTLTQLFQRFEGHPGFEWMEEIALKIDSLQKTNNGNKIIGFESNIDYSGLSFFTPLYNAIINKRVLLVTYQPFEKSPYEFEFHPYYLKQYNNRWFVLGFNTYTNSSTWNLSLDRILNLKEIPIQYQTPNMDWEYYFSEIIGVSKPINTKEELIELKLTKEILPYIQTKPIHQSQKIYITENEIIAKYILIPNYELEQVLLSFGEKIELISPLFLREKLANRIKQMQNNYK